MTTVTDKDWKILNILRKNSRMAIRDVAKATGLRPSTVHDRIKKLEETGVIEKFTIKLDNKLAGEDFIVFMNLSTEQDLPPSFFQNEHIKEVFGMTGEYDLLLKLKFKDISQFNAFILNLRKNKDITKTLTSIATITLKEDM